MLRGRKSAGREEECQEGGGLPGGKIVPAEPAPAILALRLRLRTNEIKGTKTNSTANVHVEYDVRDEPKYWERYARSTSRGRGAAPVVVASVGGARLARARASRSREDVG